MRGLLTGLLAVPLFGRIEWLLPAPPDAAAATRIDRLLHTPLSVPSPSLGRRGLSTRPDFDIAQSSGNSEPSGSTDPGHLGKRRAAQAATRA